MWQAQNTFECVRDLIRVNGIRGPYQGFSATLARNIPGSAVYFPSYARRLRCSIERDHGAVTDPRELLPDTRSCATTCRPTTPTLTGPC